MYHISLYGYQGRKWLPKTGWASSNALRHRCLSVPSILPKTGWAIADPAYPAHTPLTPLERVMQMNPQMLIHLPEKKKKAIADDSRKCGPHCSYREKTTT